MERASRQGNIQIYFQYSMTGLTHSIVVGNKTNLKSAVGVSYNTLNYNKHYIEDDYTISEEYRAKYDTRKWTVSSTLNHRFINKHPFRIGAITNFIRDGYSSLFKGKSQCSTRGNDRYKEHDATILIICSMAI